MTDPRLHDVLQAIDGSPQWEVTVGYLLAERPIAYTLRRPEFYRADAIRGALNALGLSNEAGPVTITTSKIKE